MHSCGARGPLGAPVGAPGAASGRGCPAKGLDGAGDGEALTAPSYEASCLGSYTSPPQNGWWLVRADQGV